MEDKSLTKTNPTHRSGMGLVISLTVLGLAGVAICGAAVYVGIATPNALKSLPDWGIYLGGVLTPPLTFLTFLGVLITIALQKQALSAAKEEAQVQKDATEKENFEATFFQMLTLHNTIVNSIDLVDKKSGVRTQGRDCFRVFYTRLNKIYRHNQEKAAGKHEDKRVLSLSYQLFWKETQLELGHYFRYLFNIIKFVKNSKHGDDYYIKLLRAQLSDQELLLLFYNCLSEQGAKFKLYAEEFALFDNMPTIRLLSPEHKSWIAPQAFGSNQQFG